MRITLVGVGNLGSAIARSLVRARKKDELLLIEKHKHKRSQLESDYGCRVLGALSEECVVGAGELLILCVKPQDAFAVTTTIAPFVSSEAIVLSVMAGVRVSSLCEQLKNSKIVRAMPNLGASIEESATGYYCSPAVGSAERLMVEEVISSFGRTWSVDREEVIDALTAVAGTGPAYLCWLGEQVERLAVELGISAAEAHQIVLQTFRGTVLFLEQSSLSFAELRRRVTSPQGTTAAALSVLEERGAHHAVGDAVAAACRRAKELGNA